jgi:hypothetical protein
VADGGNGTIAAVAAALFTAAIRPALDHGPNRDIHPLSNRTLDAEICLEARSSPDPKPKGVGAIFPGEDGLLWSAMTPYLIA